MTITDCRKRNCIHVSEKCRRRNCGVVDCSHYPQYYQNRYFEEESEDFDGYEDEPMEKEEIHDIINELRTQLSHLNEQLCQIASEALVQLQSERVQFKKMKDRLEVSPYGDDKIDELEECISNLRSQIDCLEKRNSFLEQKQEPCEKCSPIRLQPNIYSPEDNQTGYPFYNKYCRYCGRKLTNN